MTILIYKLINKVNHKIYIGQTYRTLEERWASGHGYVGQPYLSHAINKYGKDNFYYEIIERLDNTTPQSIVDEKEIFWISNCNSTDHKIGYNISNGGNGVGTVSEETKLKISSSKKGKKQSEAHKMSLSAVRKGIKKQPFSAEHKNNLSIAHSGEKSPSAKLTLKIMENIKEDFFIHKMRRKDIELKYKLSQATISRVINDKRWKRVNQSC